MILGALVQKIDKFSAFLFHIGDKFLNTPDKHPMHDQGGYRHYQSRCSRYQRS